MTPIQATIIGFHNKPCTLFSVYDPETRILAVSVETDYWQSRRNDCIVITNDQTLDRDVIFAHENTRDAIDAFYELQQGVASDGQSTRLVFNDRALRANPSDSIEKEGLDERGQRYRISDNISCAKVAALATCWYASRQADLFGKVMIMSHQLASHYHASDVDRLNQGMIFTI